MGVKSCQCNDHRREDNDTEKVVGEVIDNTPYEVYSDGKEGIAIKENKASCFIEKKESKQSSNSNSQRKNKDEDAMIQEGRRIGPGDHKGNQNKESDTEYISHMKGTEKFLQQIPDGPPLEIINENNKTNLSECNDNQEEEGNDNTKSNNNKQSQINTQKLSSKTNSLNNTVTQTKENQQKNTNNNNNTSNHPPPKQLKQIHKQKSKDFIYNNCNTNPVMTTNDREYSITQLISTKKLKQLADNDIVFTSKLDKMINIEDKKAITYSTRFCVLTPKYFAYYSTKENFLSLTRPLCQLNLSLISKVDKAYAVSNKCLYFSILFKLTEETIKLLKNINSFSIMNEKIEDNEEGMIGFKSTSEEIISKWVTLLQYFSQKAKE